MESIRSLNEKISRQISSGMNAGVEEKEHALAKYQELARTGKTIKIKFDSCDPEGNFTTYDDGVLVVLPGKGMISSKESQNKYASSRMIGIEFTLRVKEIDSQNKRVVCMVPAAMTAETVRSVVAREIARTLNRGNFPLVWGKVKKISPTRITVDILNQGILGFIDASHWQKCFTRSLAGMCAVGDFLQFEIIKAAPKKPGVPTAWVLSRKNITKDAWSLIDFDALKQDGAIVVECVERPVGKSFWWGKSDRVPGIEVMGDYSYRFRSGITLLEGIRYICKIEEINVCKEDHKRNVFKVVPFEVYPDDAAKISSYRELMKQFDYKNQ